jgi:PAT family beta-lactamase induction signal transducer AmpG
MPVIERFVAPRNLYLWVGLIGAIGSALIIALPRIPLSYGIAAMHESIFQAAAFSVCYAIILRTIGPDDPLAATQFSLLSSAFCLPLTYMQVIDAQGYALGGVSGAFLMDATISGAACLALLAIFHHFRRIIPAG